MQLGADPTDDPMGFASNGNVWSNCNNGPVTFRKRNERIDWRKLAAIDVERISRELDFDTLQDNIANVAFCNIECELDPRCSDPNFTKLFRLAQLIIEYLLHSQDYLSHTVVALEEKSRYLTCQLETEKKSRGCNEELIKSLKDDVKKYKKLFCVQKNSTMQQTPAECHACPFCPKIFLSSDYLQLHMKRRHLDSCQPDQQNQVATVVEKLEKEVLELKDQLHLTQCQLQEERKTKVGDDIQAWKVQQLETQKKEIEAIRDLFMKEMHELNERTTFAEYCVNNLQKELQDVCTSPPPSPPCPIPIMPSAKDDNCDLMKGQKKEFCKLRKNLTQHVEDVVCRRLKAHEDVLQKKIKCLAKEQTQELEKLNSLVQEKFSKPDKPQTDTLLQDLCERTKEQERKLKRQQRKLEELLCTQSTPKPEPEPEPKPCVTTKQRKDSDLNSNDSLQSPYRGRNAEALKKNQSLVEGLREELSVMLQEKLDNMGIAARQQNAPSNQKEVKGHPRSKSWSGYLTDVEDDEEDEDEGSESEVSEMVSVEKPNKRRLKRYPSMPIAPITASENSGEWKRKIPKRSRFLSTKESFTKLVTSVKKKLKPAKFWQSHSTPIKNEKNGETTAPVMKELQANVSSVDELHPLTESEDSEEGDDDDDDDDDDADDDDDDDEVEKKTEERIDQKPALKTTAKETLDRKPKVESSSDWESSSELEEITEKNKERSPQTNARLFTILPQKANQSSMKPISEAARALEAKLTGSRTKPFGGIDIFARKETAQKHSISTEDFDSSTSEKNEQMKNKNVRQGSTRADNNNAWVGKDANKTDPAKKAPRKSMYDWDSDEDISEIT